MTLLSPQIPNVWPEIGPGRRGPIALTKYFKFALVPQADTELTMIFPPLKSAENKTLIEVVPWPLTMVV